ncbi:hypothetical protein PO124_03095 [Bacillus licheniformis]|nr:hypothetical protein [Bacillus licheniformis]
MHNEKTPIYVEISIQAEMERLWRYTQDPTLHRQWDLRFTDITYLKRRPGEPQRFLYETRIGFGLKSPAPGSLPETYFKILETESRHSSSLQTTRFLSFAKEEDIGNTARAKPESRL